MPEVRFHVRWPDGSEDNCYSPSTIIHEYLKAGESYELDRFVDLSKTALIRAGERVEQRYGFFCTGASQQLETILTKAAKQPAGDVVVLAFL